MSTVIVTNDDGIDSPGLHALAAAARGDGRTVSVLAPDRQASGAGAGLGSTREDGTARVQARTVPGLSEMDARAVSAQPGFIVLAAMTGRLGPAPDIVLSGINDGANLGIALPHSGTLGAALIGGLHGARGMAVSVDVVDPPGHIHWESAAAVAASILPALAEAPPRTVLNVNVPNVPPAELLPLRRATLSTAGIVQTLTRFMDSFGGDRPEVVRIAGDTGSEPDSDVTLLAAGHPTVVSLRLADDGPELDLERRWPELWTG